MRRAFRALALAVLVTASCAGIANAIQVSVVNRINAIGLVDYSRKPTFKVGDYVRYRVSTGGAADAGSYILTVLIAGEEEFWGEKGFWLETWADDATGKKNAAASLMSYDIFNDSLADDRIQLYRRKIINGYNDQGQPDEELTRGTANLSSIRSAPLRGAGQIVDTLGVDTLQTPMGLLNGRRVNIQTGKSATRSEGDSTVYVESRETRSRWLNYEMPITHAAREDSRTTTGRRAWKLGYSRESGPLIVKETVFLSARVIETGHGLKPRLLPENRATSFAQQAASAAAHRTAAARPRAATPHK